MTDQKLPPFKTYIFEYFIEWEKQQPNRRSSYSAFARWLSENSYNVPIKQQMVSDWIKGKYKPEDEQYLLILEEKIGKEIYAVLNKKRPNPLLIALNNRWERIPPDKQQKLLELSEQFEIKNDEQRLQDTSKQRKKAPYK